MMQALAAADAQIGSADPARLAEAADALCARADTADAALIPLALAARTTPAAAEKLAALFGPANDRPEVATAHVIEACKIPVHRTIQVQPTDFRLGPPMPIGRLPTAFALPYCWDLANRELYATLHLRPHAVLEEPFLYGAQRKHARVLARIPFDRLDGLFGPADPTISPLLIFSIGRTGSTLLDSLVRCVTPRAVSEPDTLTQLASAGEPFAGLPIETRRAMLWHSISAFAHTYLEGGEGALLSLKMRSQVNGIAADLVDAFPRARHVFMFRNRRDWAKSTFRVFNLPPPRAAGRLLQGIRTYDRLRAAKADVALLWYEEIVADPKAAVARILNRKLTAEMDARIAATMRVDSQAGTGVSRDRAGKGRSEEEAWMAEFEQVWANIRPAGLLTKHGLDL